MSDFGAKNSGSLSMKESVAELERIQALLRENLIYLRSKLEFLDSQPQLQSSLQDLRRDANEKANSLEAEVTRLREELKTAKALLGLNLEKRNLKKS